MERAESAEKPGAVFRGEQLFRRLPIGQMNPAREDFISNRLRVVKTRCEKLIDQIPLCFDPRADGDAASHPGGRLESQRVEGIGEIDHQIFRLCVSPAVKIEILKCKCIDLFVHSQTSSIVLASLIIAYIPLKTPAASFGMFF